MFFKSPTFIGKVLVNEFYDKLSTSTWGEERTIFCHGSTQIIH
jgi:hypothetical protein